MMAAHFVGSAKAIWPPLTTEKYIFCSNVSRSDKSTSKMGMNCFRLISRFLNLDFEPKFTGVHQNKLCGSGAFKSQTPQKKRPGTRWEVSRDYTTVAL